MFLLPRHGTNLDTIDVYHFYAVGIHRIGTHPRSPISYHNSALVLNRYIFFAPCTILPLLWHKAIFRKLDMKEVIDDKYVGMILYLTTIQ